ncbi:MAG: peptidase penicillin amidase, partial [Verrucomicrobiales bacterium]|nr:peptidase penicillin amidase [Verrucomicrobiales bacterium]
SIGGDIERVDLGALEAFYGGIVRKPSADTNVKHNEYTEPTGSNGIAIAPSNTLNHHALLLINPHTSFFFRSELQMTSDEGLNVYGAVTWGQFFVYQGFNPRLGWMHTSSGVDAVDEYLETVTEKGGRFFYKYGNEERPLATRKIIVPYKTTNGTAVKEFTVFRSEHGPVIRQENGKWVAIHLMQEPLKALMQSYSRTKAHDYQSYREAMELHANSSNNTIYADADGNIAYFHANYIPKRNSHFDWTRPVDGSDPATDWGTLMTLDETPHLLNPTSGWVYNCNDWPWSAAGSGSLRREDFPRYVEGGKEESPRGVHAIGLLQNKEDYTIESLNAAAYDTYMPAFARMIPALLRAYDQTTNTDETKSNISGQIKLLRSWDYRWSVDSVPTTLAVFWGEAVGRRLSAEAGRAEMSPELYVATKASPGPLLQSLAEASEKLASDFGTWKMPWGNINRFQRLSNDIVHPFNDAGSSIPVGFTSARWGSLASFGAHAYPGTKKWYGTSGNSFVAIVEFGNNVRAKAVTAGGESGDFNSRHFNDEAERYSTGALRDVYFYRSQLKGHTERTYKPGKL